MVVGTTLLLATPLPPGTLPTQVGVYAQQGGVRHDYTRASTLAEVRTDPGFDKWYHDAANDTVYWRMIDVYIDSQQGSTSLMWMADKLADRRGLERGGLFLPDRNGGASINVVVSCTTTSGAQFCDTPPVLRVPGIECAEGNSADSISTCSAPPPPAPPSPPPLPPATPPTRTVASTCRTDAYSGWQCICCMLKECPNLSNFPALCETKRCCYPTNVSPSIEAPCCD